MQHINLRLLSVQCSFAITFKYKMFNAKRIRIRFVPTTSILMSSVKVLNGMQTGVLKRNMHNKLSSSLSANVRGTAVRHHMCFVNCNIQHGQHEFCLKIEARPRFTTFAGLSSYINVPSSSSFPILPHTKPLSYLYNFSTCHYLCLFQSFL